MLRQEWLKRRNIRARRIRWFEIGVSGIVINLNWNGGGRTSSAFWSNSGRRLLFVSRIRSRNGRFLSVNERTLWAVMACFPTKAALPVIVFGHGEQRKINGQRQPRRNEETKACKHNPERPPKNAKDDSPSWVDPRGKRRVEWDWLCILAGRVGRFKCRRPTSGSRCCKASASFQT